MSTGIFFSILYNGALLGYFLIALPKILFDLIKTGKYRKSFWPRLGFQRVLRPPTGQFVIWVHAVSVGETKAVAALCKKLKVEKPDAYFVISSCTETGHEEAKRSLSFANAHIFLPLDFSCVMRKMVQKIAPNLLIFSETDLWQNLIHSAKKEGAEVFVVNGKISSRSTKFFQKIPWYTKSVFSAIDCFCVQNESYRERLIGLGVQPNKVIVTGNLKFDDVYPIFSGKEKQDLKKELGIQDNQLVLVVGSTHDPEEKEILEKLTEVPNLVVIIVPRHPERFEGVTQTIAKLNVPFMKYTERSGNSNRVILVDKMGILRSLYAIANIAIVGGSFTDKVGGHNVLEPCAYGVPVLFGPHMFQQKELSKIVLETGAGKQIQIDQVAKTLLDWVENKALCEEMGQKGKGLLASNHGALDKTLKFLLFKNQRIC